MLQALGAVLDLIFGIGEILVSIAEFCAWIGRRCRDADEEPVPVKQTGDMWHKDLRCLTWKEWIIGLAGVALFALYLLLRIVRDYS